MEQITKANLFEKLELSRNEFLKVMKGIDIDKLVYTDGGWKARDIMLNVGYWEYEGAKSLNAFAENKEYIIPNFFEKFDEINKNTFDTYKDQEYSNLLEYFDKGRIEFMNSLKRLNENDLSKEFVPFWGGKSTIVNFILDMISHEQKHLEDIKNA